MPFFGLLGLLSDLRMRVFSSWSVPMVYFVTNFESFVLRGARCCGRLGIHVLA